MARSACPSSAPTAPSAPPAPDSAPAPASAPEAGLPAEEPMVGYLERDQLVTATLQPVARARLSLRVQAALWLLRVFVIVVGAMVIYTFIARL